MSDERVAVVTGGAGLIGRAIVESLEATGHKVVVIDQTGPFAADLADEAAVRRVAREVLETYGRCDVLVHAAAAFDRAGLADLDHALFAHAMGVNVEAALWLCQELIPRMAARGFGRIVFITSDTVFSPPPVAELLPYMMTKMALMGAARSLSRALGPDGITVNCVAPGLTPNPDHADAMPPGWETNVLARQSLQRILGPQDVAAAVAFLAGDGAEALSGQTLCPDGGMVFR
ncbi:3-oxoacyl-(acyl-carrier protein) reductase [Frankia sp. Hr75.2]|nr:3-oxoacyl-(acyl-carrier protein) reductase [Frankia sp. Hr75.2]